MRKSILATIAIGLVLFCAGPAMALDVDFSGEFRLRGINYDNVNLTDPPSASTSYYDTRARIKTTFGVNDNITFITRFDALDNRKFGSQNTSSTLPNYQDYDNFDFDVAYAIVKTPYGAFIGGRMIGSAWGPSNMGDSNLHGKDRIMWYVPVDKWSAGAYAEKSYEQDSNDYNTMADADNDKYTAFVQHKGETFQAGLLCSLYDFRAFPSMRDQLRYRKTYSDAVTQSAALTSARQTYDGSYAGVMLADPSGTSATSLLADTTGTLAAGTFTPAGTPDLYALNKNVADSAALLAVSGPAAQAGPPMVEAKAYVLDPYVSGNVGPFSYFGELIYAFGDGEYSDPNQVNITNGNDIDVDALMYHIEGKYKFGPAALRGGYWFMSGDNNTDDDAMEALGYIENNRDLDIALILTGNSQELGIYNTLGGGIGNFSADTLSLNQKQGTLAMSGGNIIYLGLGWDIMDNLSLDLAYANAKADSPPGTSTYDSTTGANYTTDWSDEVGDEYDFALKWTPLQNFEYKIQGGYLIVGDFWKQGAANAQIDDMYLLYHAMTISF